LLLLDFLPRKIWDKQRPQRIVELVAGIENLEVRGLMKLVRLHQP